MQIAPYARRAAQVVPVPGRFREVQTAADMVSAIDAADEGDGVAGTPVLFLHGWGVGPHSYDAPLAQLSALGCRVLAPAQPGFGGMRELLPEDRSFTGYARWAADYLDDMGVDERVMVIGHSFGGGVSIQFAHDFPERVSAVVVCNGVGGFPWAAASPTAPGERPLWEWGRYIGADLFALPTLARVLPALLGEAVPNLVHNPLALWRVGEFVRKADLVTEIAAVARRETPVTLVWSDRDRLVPHAGFSALCGAAGVHGVVVPGNHSWLIAEPRLFADIVLRAMVDAGVLEATLAATA
ncbi:MAG: alpha/beta fold hydrolase [Acidimicrobiales bacterium]